MACDILIISNDLDSGVELERAIAGAGCRVAGTAISSRDALQLAEDVKPDLVLVNMDLRVRQDGFTIARSLREQLQIPVIFLGPSGDQEILRRACLSGCFGFLVKPVRATELDAAIQIAIQQHSNSLRAFARHSWLTTMLDSLSDGIIATGEDGDVRYLNPAAQVLTGWMPLDAIGKPIEEVYPLFRIDTREEVRECQIRKALARRAPTGKSRFLLSTRFGVRIAVEDSATPILDGDNLLGAVTIFLDISSRIFAETNLAHEQDRLREQIAASRTALSLSNDEVVTLSGRLIHAQEEERRRIALELHDDLAQRAALISQYLDRMESSGREQQTELDQLKGFASAVSEGLREISHRLHPSIVADLGIVEALRSLVHDYKELGLEVALSTPEISEPVSTEAATALYRIAQEGLRNTLRHAPGAPARLSLKITNGDIRLRIEDAGPGFSPARAKAGHGLGLLSMQERARNVGGTLLLKSTPGEGTIIQVTAPLGNPDESKTYPARRRSR